MAPYRRLAPLLWVACHSPPPLPPQPPSPASITQATPGGDSPRPEQAALDRLARQPWGLRSDRRGRVLIPLADAANWRRVRFRLIPALTGFRYGDQHHGLAALFVREAPALAPGQDASSACLAEFERWGEQQAKLFEVELGQASDRIISWRGHPIRVRQREGSVLWWFRRRHYAGVYASFLAWSGRCATLTYAFPTDEAEKEALQARERFAAEAMGRFFASSTPP
ncbi:MAG: hypothetical protein RMJ98_00615 [Myxococcales bacterium]|nr:hypothetical protein [Polyangiaceae bacterium]MDW8247787.1 hypothetical protein [Myxococcales bacterium]